MRCTDYDTSIRVCKLMIKKETKNVEEDNNNTNKKKALKHQLED